MKISIVNYFFDLFKPMYPHLPPNLIIEFNKDNPKVRGKVCELLIPNITDLIHDLMGRLFDPADLTQEVFGKFLSRKRTFSTMRQLENYVESIVESSCADLREKKKIRESHAPHISDYLKNVQNQNTENLRNIRLFQRLTDLAVEMLPARSMEVYISYCEGLSVQDTADKMNISRSTVENTRNYIFKKLRVAIQEMPDRMGGDFIWWICIPFLILYMLIQKMLS